jgi:hypothetical protein
MCLCHDRINIALFSHYTPPYLFYIAYNEEFSRRAVGQTTDKKPQRTSTTLVTRSAGMTGYEVLCRCHFSALV